MRYKILAPTRPKMTTKVSFPALENDLDGLGAALGACCLEEVETPSDLALVHLKCGVNDDLGEYLWVVRPRQSLKFNWQSSAVVAFLIG